MTSRTVRAETAGPATIRTNLPSCDLLVVAEPGCRYAELTITTKDDTGPSADAVNNATLTATGLHLECRMQRGAGGGGTVIQTGRGGGFTSVNVGGGIFIAGDSYGSVIVNGRVVSTSGDGVTVVTGGSPITVTALVPVGSNIDAESTSGSVETRGKLDRVEARSVSGDVDIDTARTVSVNVTSGDVQVVTLTGTASVSTVSGDVTVHGGSSASARVRTVSGDVRATGGVDLDASTVSGRVRNR